MRILVLSSLAADSGCYLRARYLAAALRACGHMVTFPRAPLAKPGLLELPLSLLMYLPAIFSRRYEVLLAAKPYPNTLWPLLLKRTLTRHGRVVADVDDIDFGYRSGMGATVLRALQRPWPRRCDLVTYHNERLRQSITEVFRVPPEKLYRLDQGVALNIFHPLSAADWPARRAHLRRECGAGAGPLLIYTGHLNIASDLDAIFPAVNQVMTQHHDVHFIVGGGGPMLAAFQAQARAWPHANRIYFTGHCAPERINEWLNAADLALVYYKDRPVNLHRVSMKIRECLAAGIPVACNDVGDLAQFGPVTFQSKTSVDAFAAMIQQALDSPSTTRAALAQAGRVWVAERFDWAEIGRRFSQRLEELVAP